MRRQRSACRASTTTNAGGQCSPRISAGGARRLGSLTLVICDVKWVSPAELDHNWLASILLQLQSSGEHWSQIVGSWYRFGVYLIVSSTLLLTITRYFSVACAALFSQQYHFIFFKAGCQLRYSSHSCEVIRTPTRVTDPVVAYCALPRPCGWPDSKLLPRKYQSHMFLFTDSQHAAGSSSAWNSKWIPGLRFIVIIVLRRAF